MIGVDVPATGRPRSVIGPGRDDLFADGHELWDYRDLLWYLVLRDITVVYKQTILGIAWAVITPLAGMVVFSVVFGGLARIPSDGIPYPVFSYAAMLPWAYYSGAVTGATSSLVAGVPMFTKVYFPRLYIPLVPIFSKLADFGVAFLVLAGVMAWFHLVPSRQILYLPLLMIMMVVAAAGLGIWLSALALQYRDVRHAVQLVIQFLMYAAPVVWPVSLVPPRYRLLYGLYPMAGVIEGFRAAILGFRPMPWDLLIVGSLSAIGTLWLGTRYFRRTERIFADVA